MQVEIRYKPAFATLFVTLARGESIIAEADAMASMSSQVTMRTRFNGGLLRAMARRLFGGESLFVNEFRCPDDHASAQLVLTQPVPGDIERVDLNDGDALLLQPSAFIACGPQVRLTVGWAGFASWFSGEGLFRLKVCGTGPVWFGGYGGVFTREVHDGYVVDTGHLLAYEPTVGLRVGLAGGIFSSLLGGEGFVMKLRGRGRVYLQSRSLEGLAAWTNHHLK